MLLRFALLLLLATGVRGADELFYIGTYTNGTTSQGIYLGTLDSETGKLGLLKLAAPAKPDPTFLALSPDHRFHFAALSNEVVSFEKQPDGSLREISRQPSCGPNTCGVCTDQTGRQLFAASYDAGSVAAFPIAADGKIGPATATVMVHGSGPNADRQQSAHPHCVNVDPENHFLYVCDLGADRIWIFRIADNGSLVPANPPSVTVTAGSGPRHLAFSPNGKLVYVANELNVSTSVFSRDPATGELRTVDSLPNLPAGWPKGTGSAEIAVHPSGQWVYVSTRLQDFITQFQIDSHFGQAPAIQLTRPALKPLNPGQVAPSPVKFPRSFAIDPTGRWLVVAGETENRISVMGVDPANGQLTPTGQFQSVDRPVCVLFAE
jgi:6-phosphogluconolactonase